MTSLSELAASQPRVVNTLRAALRAGRAHHAYAIVGRNARSNLEVANAIAQAMVCTEPQEGSGCGVCAGCRKHQGHNHPDVLAIAPNERDVITIDAIRDTAQRLALRAQEATTKVVIVEAADRMNLQAQNALLKTLEEPPGPCCFALDIRRYRALLPTVRSRCQRLRLLPPPPENAAKSLIDAGIPAPVASQLSALVGADSEQAARLVELGAGTMIETLRNALDPQATLQTLLNSAAELGDEKARTALAVALVEIELRDRLAARHGATAPALISDEPPVSAEGELAAAVDHVHELRRLAPFNLNRTMSLERLLLAAAGHSQSDGAQT